MQIFLDSSTPDEIRRAAATGFLSGVTTNPHLLSGSPEITLPVLKDLASAVHGPFNLQVLSDKAEEMVSQGKIFSKLGPNIVVKVPLTAEGLKACDMLTQAKIPVNVTLCFSVAQAILAAEMGATYISPFVGRLDDSGGDGLQLVEDIRVAYDMGSFETQILAASIRTREQLEGASVRGAECATCPAKVFFSLHEHPLTDQGLENITKHYSKLKTQLSL